MSAPARPAKGAAVKVAQKLPGHTKKQAAAATDKSDSGRMDKEIVKAVLASPLTVPWPNIPRHLQYSVLQTIPQLVPENVASYHVSRQRCQKQDSRRKQKDRRKAQDNAKAVSAGGGTGVNGEKAKIHEASKVEDREISAAKTSTGPGGDQKRARKRASTPPIAARPAKKARKDASETTTTKEPQLTTPEILQHLVIGTNETIKELERNIDELKLRLMMIADKLNETQNKGKQKRAAPRPEDLLPTAPLSPSSSSSPSPPPSPLQTHQALPDPPERSGQDSSTRGVSAHLAKPKLSPIGWILIPLPSISPQSIVSPIPQYCATYNSLLYQWLQLKKVAEKRIPQTQLADVLGESRDEIRVVPLGKVELEMSQIIGLRRVACLSIRTSHPLQAKLHAMLPKSILHPPRHSLTLPFPTAGLKIHTGNSSAKSPGPTVAKTSAKQAKKSTNPPPAVADGEPVSKPPPAVPLPHVHYAPLTIKGITTTTPADAASKKQKRLEEVRKRRIETKEKKREARRVLLKKGLKGVGDKARKANLVRRQPKST